MRITGWVIVLLLGEIAAIDVVLAATHHPTISEFFRHLARMHWGWKLAIVAVLAFAAYHFIWQPLGSFWDDPPPDPPSPATWCGEECDG